MISKLELTQWRISDDQLQLFGRGLIFILENNPSWHHHWHRQQYNNFREIINISLSFLCTTAVTTTLIPQSDKETERNIFNIYL